MPQIGPLEILVIFVVALLVFGPKEIPRVARQAAKAWREVQRFQASVRRDIDDVLREVDEDEADERGRPPTLPPRQAELPAGGTPGPDAAAEEPSDALPPADPTP
jgi:sec-independent protein translocase protein TatB